MDEIDREINNLIADERLKSKYQSQKPHYYLVTIPYQGCGQCGFGPGASFHNTYEIERYFKEYKNKVEQYFKKYKNEED